MLMDALRRHAVYWQRRSLQCMTIPERSIPLCVFNARHSPAHSANPLGRRLHRICLAVRMGRHGHRALHRTLGSRRSMVRSNALPHPLGPIITCECVQGHPHHGLVHPRRRRAHAADPDQEPDLYHLLRSRRHLRRHHGHCLLGQAEPGAGRGGVLGQHLLHGLRALLGGPHGRHVQLDMRCCCRYQRQRCRAGGCR